MVAWFRRYGPTGYCSSRRARAPTAAPRFSSSSGAIRRAIGDGAAALWPRGYVLKRQLASAAMVTPAGSKVDATGYRTSSQRGLLFYRLIEQAVVTPPTTYQQTVRPDLRA